jgi:hypothetical protein
LVGSPAPVQHRDREILVRVRVARTVSSVLYKDYFTPDEAAEYCCMSPSHFETHVAPVVPKLRLTERKIVYRRSDLQRWIEEHGNDRVAGGEKGPVRVSQLVRRRGAAS